MNTQEKEKALQVFHEQMDSLKEIIKKIPGCIDCDLITLEILPECDEYHPRCHALSNMCNTYSHLFKSLSIATDALIHIRFQIKNNE